MSNGPLFWAEWADPDSNEGKYQYHQVPVVKIHDEVNVEILFKKRLLTVPKKDLVWARWD